jgi:hypothetical protein
VIDRRALRAGGWMAVSGAAAVMTGSTPIGATLVAAVAGTLAWSACADHSRAGG